MTGPEHYREAERLLKVATKSPSGQQRVDCIAAAQVHATLAHAAAAAMSAPVEDDLAGFTVEDRDAWYAVAGTRPGTKPAVEEATS
ncbi:hypothetical protein AB0D91_05515 [Streptomyces canus]|uniref:hypothetical protein n=1 Tax=Streptomyces canus TaxID=58343 RepID=UPI0033E73725